MARKKLYRSVKYKELAGVCGGLAEYFDTDPVLVRILWVVFTLFTTIFPGVILYLAMWLIVPEAKK